MEEEIRRDETQSVAIEEVEGVSIETVTAIDDALVHLLASVVVRRDERARRLRPLYYAIAIFMMFMAFYWAYTYGITKTGTRGPAIIALMAIMSGTLLSYLRTPPIQVAERRMRSYLKQEWHYRFDEEGVHTVHDNMEDTFKWEELSCWWEEDGFLLLEIQGQLLAVREDNVSPEELKALKELCYIYLGEARQDKAAPEEEPKEKKAKK